MRFDPNTESILWRLVKSDSLLQSLRTGEEWALPSISSLDGRPFGFAPQQRGRMGCDAIDIRDGLQDIFRCSKCTLPISKKKHNLILTARNAKHLVSEGVLARVFPSYFGTQGQHSNLVSSGGGCNHSIRSHSGLGCGCVVGGRFSYHQCQELRLLRRHKMMPRKTW